MSIEHRRYSSWKDLFIKMNNSEDDFNITSVNFKRLELFDTLNIKFQNEYKTEKIQNYLHHSVIVIWMHEIYF